MKQEDSLPHVTIVTPSYNQSFFIRQTIESVLSQDYSRVEYMVIDGKSSDETVDILKSYSERLFWVSEEDKGQAHAINKGWKLAKGEIFAWLNSDDVYMPGAVSKAVQFLRANPAVGMVYGEADHIDEEGKIIDRYPTEKFDSRRLMETCIICQPTAFIRRSVLENVGFLDESLKFSIDYDLWIRIAKKYQIGYLSEHLAQSRFYRDTKTLRDRAAVYRETVGMIKHHYGFAPASWICGYAYRKLESHFNRDSVWQNAVFYAALLGVSLWNYLRYNARMPLSELKPWFRGLRQGLIRLHQAETKRAQ
jgi:glycosyltransferase involved in cell wall biosynthesis